MRRLVTLVLCVLGVSPLFATRSARAAGEVVAEPSVVIPGQTVKLRWYFTGTKVTVSGGRFGKGQVVTGHTSLTDSPRKSTTYTFDVDYTVKEKADSKEPADAADASKPLHAQYTVTAEVDTAPPAHLATYADPHGWKIDYLPGWKRDVSTPDNGDEGLMFFQTEKDSVERLAVAVLPAKDKTCEDLLKDVIADIPSHYTEPKFKSPSYKSVVGNPGQWVTFTALDNAHPDTRTASVVLVVIRDGRAYIVSARTYASKFQNRRLLMERMIESLVFTTARSANQSAPSLQHVRAGSPNQI